LEKECEKIHSKLVIEAWKRATKSQFHHLDLLQILGDQATKLKKRETKRIFHHPDPLQILGDQVTKLEEIIIN
jgi:hypothetical protein